MALTNPSLVPIAGPGTPYITPEMLRQASTGIAWSNLPKMGATVEQQLAEITNICVRATAMVDGHCDQPLRATVDTEEFVGPGDFRCQLQPTGVARLLASRFPVTSIVSGKVSSAGAFPRSWSTVSSDYWDVEIPVIGMYGTSAPSSSGAGGAGILLAPGWVTWMFGRSAYRIQVTYVNGWPHCSLTASVAEAASTVTVDDITGWDGASGTLYDDGGIQEFVTVSSVTPATSGAISGPGTLTLSSALSFGHQAGTMLSALPASVQQAAIYYAVAQALTRGATSTAVQTVSGGASGGGTKTQQDYIQMANDLVHPYRRVL